MPSPMFWKMWPVSGEGAILIHWAFFRRPRVPITTFLSIHMAAWQPMPAETVLPSGRRSCASGQPEQYRRYARWWAACSGADLAETLDPGFGGFDAGLAGEAFEEGAADHVGFELAVVGQEFSSSNLPTMRGALAATVAPLMKPTRGRAASLR